MRRILVRSALLISVLVVSLLMAEGGARLLAPAHFLVAGRVDQVLADAKSLAMLVMPDEQVGWVPRRETWKYDAFGVRPGDHVRDRRPGTVRVLVAGDSVAHRGRIQAALAPRWGDEVEWLNAGVEAFNTVQEAVWYERHNRLLAPDRVVLLFHPNDFELTPIPSFDEAGRLMLLAPGAEALTMRTGLFRHSVLYRWTLMLRIQGGFAPRTDTDGVHAALERWKDLVEEDGGELVVAVLPMILPEERWAPVRHDSRRDVMAMLGSMGVPTVDLAPVLRGALAEGLPLADLQESPGDSLHPSDALAERFATALDSAWGRPGG